jgi:hypothetical protein
LYFEKTEKTSARNPYCPNILVETISTNVTLCLEVMARTGGLFFATAEACSILVPGASILKEFFTSTGVPVFIQGSMALG